MRKKHLASLAPPKDAREPLESLLKAGRLIIEWSADLNEHRLWADKLKRAAVERQFEVIAEALNRLRGVDEQAWHQSKTPAPPPDSATRYDVTTTRSITASSGAPRGTNSRACFGLSKTYSHYFVSDEQTAHVICDSNTVRARPPLVASPPNPPPMIDWTPVDLLTCLETEPAVDEEATSYRYTTRRHGLVLALEIWPYANDVWLAIRQADRDEPLIDLRMEGCREIRYLRHGNREELYFVSHDPRSQHPVNLRGGWRLQVAPHIEVKLGHPPAI